VNGRAARARRIGSMLTISSMPPSRWPSNCRPARRPSSTTPCAALSRTLRRRYRRCSRARTIRGAGGAACVTAGSTLSASAMHGGGGGHGGFVTPRLARGRNLVEAAPGHSCAVDSEVTSTSTDIPAKASAAPTKLPDTGIACRMSRTTATGIRLNPPTLRLVGSNVIQPAPGT